MTTEHTFSADNDAEFLLQQVKNLKTENDGLKSQLMNTSLINELTKVMNSSTDLGSIIKTLLLGIQEIVQFDRIILYEVDTAQFLLRPSAWIGLDSSEVKSLCVPMGFEGGDITDSIFLNRHLIVEHPDKEHDSFARTLGSLSYLVMPMLTKATRRCYEQKQCSITTCPAHGGFNPYCWSISGSGQMLASQSEDDRRHQCIQCPCFKVAGVFWMDRNTRAQPISSDDITIVNTIINLSGILIENFRIFHALEKANSDLSSANKQLKIVNHDLEVAQAKINNDLKHARSIQQGLLPQNLQDTTELAIGARYIPAIAVGGDYYDVFAISPSVYGIVVADVSGHGVASALIMSMAKILLKTFASSDLSPQKTLEKINHTFLTEIKTDNFVTLFYGMLDTTAHKLTYTSAGHCPMLFLNKVEKKATRINADGLFLGVFPDMMLNESSFDYVPGQARLVLYTDGLTEHRNADDEMFDLDRLESISLESAGLSPAKTVDAILECQRTFCGMDRAPEDDITILILDL